MMTIKPEFRVAAVQTVSAADWPSNREQAAGLIERYAAGEKVDFSAVPVDLDGVDVKKDGVIDLSGTKKAVAREPDGVQWIDAERFVTANEGDWKGGRRGFTIFKADGTGD